MSMSDKLNELQQLIIQEHRELFEESPTPMKLQKLCYYSQGLALGENKVELIPDSFQAWQHGPVNPDLYHKYKEYKWKPIDVDMELDDVRLLTEKEKEHVKKVVRAFGRFDGAALSTMTHRESPWLDARKGIPETEGSNAEITKEAMKDYFIRTLREFEEDDL